MRDSDNRGICLVEIKSKLLRIAFRNEACLVFDTITLASFSTVRTRLTPIEFLPGGSLMMRHVSYCSMLRISSFIALIHRSLSSP